MKRFIILTTVLFFSLSLFSQKKWSEYRYFGLKIYPISNISLPPSENQYLMIKTPYGDMLKQNNEVFAYTPGGGISLFFNVDQKSDKTGIVFGLNVENYGFQNMYQAIDADYKVKNQYRVTQIGIPVYLKYWSSNIYKQQLYMTVGFEYDLFIATANIQKSNWDAMPYTRILPREEVKTSAFAATMGFNYNIYFFNVKLLSSNFVNKKYITRLDEGVITPYQDINIFNNLYIETGINIPMTRWLTARNWTAERIRRAFRHVQ